MLIKKREKDQRRLLAVLLLLEAFLVVLLLVVLLVEARRLRLAPAFLALSARNLAFLLLVRAAFWAEARRCVFVCAMFRMKCARQYVVQVSCY